MGRRPKPVFPRVTAADAPRLAAELFVECLESEGVEYVFGIPGEETLDLNEALDRSARITFVPTRHEQGAAFMADAYGRLTGDPGVCLATLGPGATNLATGIGDANLDNAPLVALTGQIDLVGMHRETHQFIDTIDMLRPMTKWNARVHDPRMISEAVRKAFSTAAAEKPGATHLELPADVMGTSIVGRPMQPGPETLAEADPVSLLRAVEALQAAETPVMLVGNGVVRQRASQALRAFCEETGLHVITTFMGKGVVDAASDHFLFTAGLRAQNYPQGIMGRADLVVCVGYDMIEWPPSAWNPDGRQTIVCIDTVPPEIDAHYVPEVQLIGDLSRILYQLAGLVRGKEVAHPQTKPYRRAFSALLDTGSDDDLPVKPQRVLRDLRAALAPKDVLVSDVGAHKLWVARFWEAREPIEIRVVINRLNAPYLESIATFIYRNFPFVYHYAFMGMEITGLAVDNFNDIWIDPYEYRDQLSKAVNILSRAGTNVSVYNLPLCLLDKKIWGFAAKSISSWKNSYLDICNRCKVKRICSGVFTTSGLHQSNYISPQ